MTCRSTKVEFAQTNKHNLNFLTMDTKATEHSFNSACIQHNEKKYYNTAGKEITGCKFTVDALELQIIHTCNSCSLQLIKSTYQWQTVHRVPLVPFLFVACYCKPLLASCNGHYTKLQQGGE